MTLGTIATKVKSLMLAGNHPVYIMARCGLDSRQLAIAIAAISGVKVPAYCLPQSGLRCAHYLPVFQRLGHYGLPRMR